MECFYKMHSSELLDIKTMKKVFKCKMLSIWALGQARELRLTQGKTINIERRVSSNKIKHLNTTTPALGKGIIPKSWLFAVVPLTFLDKTWF